MKYTPAQLQQIALQALFQQKLNPAAFMEKLNALSRRSGLSQVECLGRINRIAEGGRT